MRQSDSFEEEPEPEDFFDYVKATSDNDDDYIFNLTNTSRRTVDTSEEETNDSTKESPLINIFRTGKLHSKLGRSAEKRPRLSQDGFGRGRKVTVVKHDNKKNRPRSREDSDEEDDYRRKLNKSISEERKKEKEGKKAPRGNRERERKRKSRRMVKLVDEEDNECREHLSKSAFLEKKRVRDSDIFSRRAKSISPVRSNQKIQLALEISRSRFVKKVLLFFVKVFMNN